MATTSSKAPRLQADDFIDLTLSSDSEEELSVIDRSAFREPPRKEARLDNPLTSPSDVASPIPLQTNNNKPQPEVNPFRVVNYSGSVVGGVAAVTREPRQKSFGQTAHPIYTAAASTPIWQHTYQRQPSRLPTLQTDINHQSSQLPQVQPLFASVTTSLSTSSRRSSTSASARTRPSSRAGPSARSSQATPLSDLAKPASATKKKLRSFTLDVKSSSISLGSGPFFEASHRASIDNVVAKCTLDASVAAAPGVRLHNAFSRTESNAVKRAILQHPTARVKLAHLGPEDSFKTLLQDVGEADILKIAANATKIPQLSGRSSRSVENFLRDFVNDVSRTTQSSALHLKIRTPTQHDRASFDSQVRQREIGTGNQRLLETYVYDTYGPSASFTGTSGDVNCIAWSPDGNKFAAGSACTEDRESMQYNRPNNLAFGDLEARTLQELPVHWIPRKHKTPAEGVNSTHSMQASQDQRLFMSVSAVAFSSTGHEMYSSSYDGTVRSWSVPGSGPPSCEKTFNFKTKADLLTVNPHSGQVAIGLAKVPHTNPDSSIKSMPIRIIDSEGRQHHSLHSGVSLKFPDKKILPSALRWSPHQGLSNYLLAGFSSNVGVQDWQTAEGGDFRIWDLNRPEVPITTVRLTRSVYDCAWNPLALTGHLFAFGCAETGVYRNRGTKSVVKMFDPNMCYEKYIRSCELECPALDMNDVVYCPYVDTLIAAGCTDGCTYVWDTRNPGEILHRLYHDNPAMEFSRARPREEIDTGVRFCSWGHNTNRLYTGSSDGVLKVWDVCRSPEDVHIEDKISFNSGIMCGSFTSDFSKLLIGEVNGSINTLEVGQEDKCLRTADKFKLLPAPLPSVLEPPDNIGVREGREKIQSGKIKLVPCGALPRRQAVQGPNYDGPFNRQPDVDVLRVQTARLQHQLHCDEDARDPRATPCNIPGCTDSALRTADDLEVEDSGAAKKRIPYDLKLGKVDRKDGEKEHFACFRCGEPAIVALRSLVHCQKCRLAWEGDVLGYRLLTEPGRSMQAVQPGSLVELSTQPASALPDLSTGAGESDALDQEDVGADEYYHSAFS